MPGKATALSHMGEIKTQIERKQREIETLRVAYGGWRSIAYPLEECNHTGSHFCGLCGNNK